MKKDAQFVIVWPEEDLAHAIWADSHEQAVESYESLSYCCPDPDEPFEYQVQVYELPPTVPSHLQQALDSDVDEMIIAALMASPQLARPHRVRVHFADGIYRAKDLELEPKLL